MSYYESFHLFLTCLNGIFVLYTFLSVTPPQYVSAISLSFPVQTWISETGIVNKEFEFRAWNP